MEVRKLLLAPDLVPYFSSCSSSVSQSPINSPPFRAPACPDTFCTSRLVHYFLILYAVLFEMQVIFVTLLSSFITEHKSVFQFENIEPFVSFLQLVEAPLPKEKIKRVRFDRQR